MPNYSVDRKATVEPEEAQKLWVFYDEIFAPLNENSPCRQSFHYQEFLKAMADPTILKLLVYEDGVVSGLALVDVITDDPDHLPWLSPAYFKKHYPDWWGRLLYVPTICVPLDRRGKGTGAALMREILQYMREMGYPYIGFDHSASLNKALAKMIIFLTKGKPVGGYTEEGQIEDQRYWFLGDRQQLSD